MTFLSHVFQPVSIVLAFFFKKALWTMCLRWWVGKCFKPVSDQFQTSLPLLGLALGYLSFKYLIEYWSPKVGVLEIKNLKVN